MLKLKKIRISAFRGILDEKILNLVESSKHPASLALFGMNSTGKSSFVDGIEWFFSRNNEIEWLKRENAGNKAYQHQATKTQQSFVEIEFDDSNKKLLTLKKELIQNRLSTPVLMAQSDFNKLYSSFVIKPFLRYQEVIDFVFDKTSAQKYKVLARWMGFEDELEFQEKIALNILPILRDSEKELEIKIASKKDELIVLTSLTEIKEVMILDFCKKLLNDSRVNQFKSLDEINQHLNIKRDPTKEQTIFIKLSEAKTFILSNSINANFYKKIDDLNNLIKDLIKDKGNLSKIDFLSLYEQGLKILSDSTNSEAICPLCGKKWNREELINEIKDNFGKINDLKIKKVKIVALSNEIRQLVENEIELLNELVNIYKNIASIIPSLNHGKIDEYLKKLREIKTEILSGDFTLLLPAYDFLEEKKTLEKEKFSIQKLIEDKIKSLGVGSKDLKQEDTINKVKNSIILFNQYKKLEEALAFYRLESEKFLNISKEITIKIQKNITDQFKRISGSIQNTFNVLRNDKKINNIEIELNTSIEKAIGRSAEIKLSYYDIEVKPAYKVLSESLLNSLGLAIYFTCVKEFNKECKFIILDDVMNSLDITHRDTLIDLFFEELKEYQFIIFTHDEFWFQKIQKKFPSWELKKIKKWSYHGGPTIDKNPSTLEEVDELLEDDTKARDAASKLTLYIEDSLNEICEQVEAQLKYRYHRNDPPNLNELFSALENKIIKEVRRDTKLIKAIKNVHQIVPLLRNFSDHSKTNYPSSITSEEVKNAKEKWIILEKLIYCPTCMKYVSFSSNKKIECKGGHFVYN